MKNSCLCCGIPLERATRYVAIMDILLGASTFIFLLFHVRKPKDTHQNENEFEEISFDIYWHPNGHFSTHTNSFEKPKVSGSQSWFITACIVCTGMQCVMGIFLYVAVSMKSRGICRFWMFVTGTTCLFTGFLIRVYQMLVVSEFSTEIEHEERQQVIQNSCRRTMAHPITPQQVIIPMETTNNNSNSNNGTTTTTITSQNHLGNQSWAQVCQNSANLPAYSSVFAPPTPPSYVPEKEEDQPPPYHIAIKCPPAKYY